MSAQLVELRDAIAQHRASRERLEKARLCFDPSQQRAEDGKWTDGGGGGWSGNRPAKSAEGRAAALQPHKEKLRNALAKHTENPSDDTRAELESARNDLKKARAEVGRSEGGDEKRRKSVPIEEREKQAAAHKEKVKSDRKTFDDESKAAEREISSDIKARAKQVEAAEKAKDKAFREDLLNELKSSKLDSFDARSEIREVFEGGVPNGRMIDLPESSFGPARRIEDADIRSSIKSDLDDAGLSPTHLRDSEAFGQRITADDVGDYGTVSNDYLSGKIDDNDASDSWGKHLDRRRADRDAEFAKIRKQVDEAFEKHVADNEAFRAAARRHLRKKAGLDESKLTDSRAPNPKALSRSSQERQRWETAWTIKARGATLPSGQMTLPITSRSARLLAETLRGASDDPEF